MGLLRGHGDYVRMDPSQIGVHRGVGTDARDIQCDAVLMPGFVDGNGGRAMAQMSSQGTRFTATLPLCPT